MLWRRETIIPRLHIFQMKEKSWCWSLRRRANLARRHRPLGRALRQRPKMSVLVFLSQVRVRNEVCFFVILVFRTSRFLGRPAAKPALCPSAVSSWLDVTGRLAFDFFHDSDF